MFTSVIMFRCGCCLFGYLDGLITWVCGGVVFVVVTGCYVFCVLLGVTLPFRALLFVVFHLLLCLWVSV